MEKSYFETIIAKNEEKTYHWEEHHYRCPLSNDSANRYVFKYCNCKNIAEREEHQDFLDLIEKEHNDAY